MAFFNSILFKMQHSIQVTVTARDRYSNVITSGDAGFTMVYPQADILVPNSFSRTVSNGQTVFSFRIVTAGMFVMRFETSSGVLVHQSKVRVKPGGISHRNSKFLGLPASFTVGTTMVTAVQIRDAYGNVFAEDTIASQFQLSARDTRMPSRTVKVCSQPIVNLTWIDDEIDTRVPLSFTLNNATSTYLTTPRNLEWYIRHWTFACWYDKS
jgi:hypothetical protein